MGQTNLMRPPKCQTQKDRPITKLLTLCANLPLQEYTCRIGYCWPWETSITSRWFLLPYVYLCSIQVRYLSRRYFRDHWNWLTIFSLITYFVGIGLQYGDSVECFEAARILRSLDFMSFMYLLLQYSSLSDHWGLMLPMFYHMVSVYFAIPVHIKFVISQCAILNKAMFVQLSSRESTIRHSADCSAPF